MEDFIDYILSLILIAVIAFTGTLVFFLYKDPTTAYRLLALFFCGMAGGIGILLKRFYRKKRLGEYYELFRELPQLRKDIQRSIKQLERHSRKTIAEQLPQIRKLCSQAQRRLKKIVEIEKTLRSFEKTHIPHNPRASHQTRIDTQATHAGQERYLHNIRRIEQSKQQHLQQVHEILYFLHELNSQIQALRFSQTNQTLQEDIAETIDELLIDIQSLEDLT